MTWATRGWQVFDPDPRVVRWLEHAGPAAIALTKNPTHIKDWLRCGGTWFAGVNLLQNDGQGRVAGSDPLTCTALQAAAEITGDLPLDKAQISVTYPGYPQPGATDSPANFRFRRDRDAAHLDGLLPVGPNRRRFMKEPHGWILGLPVTACSGGAAPLVVWEGSHKVMRDAFREKVAQYPVSEWKNIDLTQVYHTARRAVFDTCERITLEGQPGQAHLLHRLTLHGVAPWADGAIAPPEGRVILYFRPELPGGAGDWLNLP